MVVLVEFVNKRIIGPIHLGQGSNRFCCGREEVFSIPYILTWADAFAIIKK